MEVAHNCSKRRGDYFAGRFTYFRHSVIDLEIAENTFNHYHVKHA